MARSLFPSMGKPSVCNLKFLKLQHHVHSPLEESIIIERPIQYIKDRSTECFDDYFPYRKKKNCKLKHINQW